MGAWTGLQCWVCLPVLPPLKEKIFNTEQDGYAWTPVKISGTAEKIDEDL